MQFNIVFAVVFPTDPVRATNLKELGSDCLHPEAIR
jgi:hypothetical protein